MMRPLADIPEGLEELVAIIRLDHRQLSNLPGLEFQPIEEEMGTRYDAAFESANGSEFYLTEPAYEPELGVHVYLAAGTELLKAESELLDSLQLEVEDLRWRAGAIHFSDGDVVSVDPDASDDYFPDSVGKIVGVAYVDHPDLVPVPDVNPAVYSVWLDRGQQLAVPSNLLIWEPILHAEAVETASDFTSFLSTLAHHMVVRPDNWDDAGGATGLVGRLITRVGVRDAAALQARSQLAARWGTIAVSILEAVAPADWGDPDDD